MPSFQKSLILEHFQGNYLKGSPRRHAGKVPLAHRFIRRNRSFSEVKNLATSLIIICQKEKNPVIFRKNRHALRTCGSAVTQRFIPYCQLSSRTFKLSVALIEVLHGSHVAWQKQ